MCAFSGDCVASRTLQCRSQQSCSTALYNASAGVDTSLRCDRLDCNSGSNFWYTRPALDGTPCGGGATASTRTASLCVNGTCVGSGRFPVPVRARVSHV
jgi:hypothetical protein